MMLITPSWRTQEHVASEPPSESWPVCGLPSAYVCSVPVSRAAVVAGRLGRVGSWR